MKKVIQNKLYNTESARAVGYHQYLNQSDCHWYGVTLYRKRTGEYFLHGEGGAMSLYGKKVGQNEWIGGESIIPIAYERARDWAERYLDADEYQEEFGAVSEGDERTVLSVSISAELADRIRREAKEKGMTVSALIASKF